ncbi:MAG: RNA polymerase subunit sigma-70 [Planctomycetes bacterium]|nr:RNA polymerase subunit sigma-70 [Planctomycetota bacterium]
MRSTIARRIDRASTWHENSRASDTLSEMAPGPSDAKSDLFPVVYGELRGLAHRIRRDGASGQTLQTTALVHEAWLKLQKADLGFENRLHFLRTAAQAMRRILVDHARARSAGKRAGGREQVALDEQLAIFEQCNMRVTSLDIALERLAGFDNDLAQIVELRFFAGLDGKETGEVLALTRRQLDRKWAVARSWLLREIEAIETSA